MNIHQNASLTPRGRAVLISRLDRGEHPMFTGPPEPCLTWSKHDVWHVYACVSGLWHRHEQGPPWWRRWLSFLLGPAPTRITHREGPCGHECRSCEAAAEALGIIQRRSSFNTASTR